MQKNNSFEGLRIIFSLLVLLNHCTFLKRSLFGEWVFEHLLHNGRFSVTFFFTLSSFCIYLRHGKDIIEPGIRQGFVFAIERMKRIYPLYLACMVWAGLWTLYINNGKLSGDLIYKIILTLTLTQTWTLKRWALYNSVSWFLSTMFFLYICTPYMMMIVQRIKKGRLRLSLCLALFWIVGYDCLLIVLQNRGYCTAYNSMLLGYVFPLYWIPIYFSGMLVARIKESSMDIETCSTKHELLICFICICSYLVGLNGSSFIIKYWRSLFYVVSILALICIFSFEGGTFSKGLASISSISNYSAEIYLIHFQVINGGGLSILDSIGLETVPILEMVIIIALTGIISIIWKKWINKLIGTQDTSRHIN